MVSHCGVGARWKPGERCTQKERRMEAGQHTLPKSKHCESELGCSWTLGHLVHFLGVQKSVMSKFLCLHLLWCVLNDVTKILRDSVKKPYIIKPVHSTSGQSHIYQLCNFKSSVVGLSLGRAHATYVTLLVCWKVHCLFWQNNLYWFIFAHRHIQFFTCIFYIFSSCYHYIFPLFNWFCFSF